MTKITGYGDKLTVNGICIGDLSPKDHENIEIKMGGQNYNPLPDVVISAVKDSSTLICRKPDENNLKSYIEDELIDGLCCYSAVNQGQLNKTIVNAIMHHLKNEKIPTVPRSIRHKYMSAFLLAATSVTGVDRVVPKVAGVEAPELMFKLARRWGYVKKGIPKDRAIIVGAKNNFHGRTMTAVSLSDDRDSKNNFGPFLQGIELVPFNHIQALEKLFKEKGEYIAAYLVEPIQGEAGVIIPDSTYWIQVKKLCKKYNILLAFDEVQTGFGRTGNNFAYQGFNVKPDLIGCGKAAGGGILPVSFVGGRNEIIELLTPGSEGSTFGGYPLAAITSVYAIKVLIDEKLAENAEVKGQYLMQNLSDIKRKYPDKIKEVRGKGLLTAFEMYNESRLDGHKVSMELLKHGVYAKETHHTTIRIAPALTIKKNQINKITSAIERVIKDL